MICNIIANISSFYITISYVDLLKTADKTLKKLLYLRILSIILLLLSLIFIIISSVKKQKRTTPIGFQ
jgi:lipopolysaccharide/colanic/teichoic acid biosynthesis glycosyltransferase